MLMRSLCRSIRFGSRLVSLSSPLVMAIVNATPDSFYAASRATDERALRDALTRAMDEGADIIDIGACSTRPAVQAGGGIADEQVEWERLSRALTVARQMNIHVPLSVDTFRQNIARRAIEEFGVEMINDISGKTCRISSPMCSQSRSVVLTYNRVNDPDKTDNLLADAIRFLGRKVDELHQAGVSDVVVDPGFGFGQTVQESLILLANLGAFRQLGCPILVGISRKRMAYERAGLTPETCLEPTLQLEAQAIANGADILRVHDVAATRMMMEELRSKGLEE